MIITFWVFTGNFVEVSNITIRNGGVGIVPEPLHDPSCGPNATHEPHYLMQISNMTFANNFHGLVFRSDVPDCNAQYILLRDSVITECVKMTVGHPTVVLGSHMFQITLKNVSFSSNTAEQPNHYFISIIIAQDMPNVTFIDCTFENNQLTAILAVGSNLRFQSNNTFRNNSANNGAGIMLLDNSYKTMRTLHLLTTMPVPKEVPCT